MRRACLSIVSCALAIGLCLRAQETAEPGDPRAQVDAATTLLDQARYQEAMDAFDRVLGDTDATLVTRARKGKVRAALRVAEFDVARREADRLRRDSGPDVEVLTLHGDALWGSGFFDEADAAYAEALRMSPDASRARYGLARSLAMRMRLDEALSEARAAAAVAPRDPEIQALIGDILERTYRYDDAADAFEAGAAFLPESLRIPSNPLVSKPRYLRSFKGKRPMLVEGKPGALHSASFRLVNRKILLDGRVNNTPVQFVLDTGSERTTVARDTAARAGIRPVSSTLTAGIGVPSLRPLAIGRADRIEIGGLRIRDVPVSIRGGTVPGMPRWQSETFSPIALGLSVVVDYERRRVTFGRELPAGAADIRLPMRVYRLPMVRGLLNDTHPAYFVVDTGGEMISISLDTAQAVSPLPERRIGLRVFGMSGLDPDAFLLPGMKLDFDAIRYQRFGLAVLNLRAPSVLLGFQVGGIVGHRFLGDYRVAMDMGRGELRLERFAGSR